MLPAGVGMTGMGHHTQLFFPLRWGLFELFARAGL
jgi:hypothetical protein